MGIRTPSLPDIVESSRLLTPIGWLQTTFRKVLVDDDLGNVYPCRSGRRIDTAYYALLPVATSVPEDAGTGTVQNLRSVKPDM